MISQAIRRIGPLAEKKPKGKAIFSHNNIAGLTPGGSLSTCLYLFWGTLIGALFQGGVYVPLDAHVSWHSHAGSSNQLCCHLDKHSLCQTKVQHSAGTYPAVLQLHHTMKGSPSETVGESGRPA